MEASHLDTWLYQVTGNSYIEYAPAANPAGGGRASEGGEKSARGAQLAALGVAQGELQTVELREGCSLAVTAGTPYRKWADRGAVGVSVAQDPQGNKSSSA